MELAESVEDAVAPGLDLESQIYSLDLGTLKDVYLECFVVLVCFAAAFEELRNAIMKLNPLTTGKKHFWSPSFLTL